MGKGFEIRHATLSDIPAIAEITKEAFTAYARLAGQKTVDALSETYDMIAEDIEKKLVLVAFMDGEVVGSVRVEIREDGTAYLSRFGVSTSSQNHGIGKSLINMVDMEMMARGVKRISLHTGSKITSLIRFYYGRGYYVESTSTDRGYIRALLVKDYE